jgi:peptidoglycan/LPS O-acetylase OafA/YrhL
MPTLALAPHAPAALAPDRTGADGRVVALDGLRGLAALLVVAAHYLGEVPSGLQALALGWLGVDLFFVLSGFLIGSIVLEARGRPGFARVFYLRRAARILPVYLVVVALTLAGLGALGPRPWTDPALPAWTYLTFTQNIVMAGSGIEGSAWLLPTWTLAVEQQFYLLLPLLVCFAPARALPWLVGGGIAGAILFRAAAAGWGPLPGFVLLPARADLLLFGVGAAVLRHRGIALPMTALRAAPLAAALALLAVAATDVGGERFKLLGPTLAGFGSAAFILGVVAGAPEAQRYRGPAWRFFGTISYGLYLVHQPVAGLLHGLLLGARPDVGSAAAAAVTAAAFALSVLLAALSWRFLEAPLIRAARARPYGARAEAPP